MAKTSSTPLAIKGSGSEAPRSDVPGSDPIGSGTDTASQKRGRGRPPKVKSESKQNDGVSAKRSGRPKRNVATAVATTSVAAAVKSRVRSNPPTVTASVVTTSNRDGSRKRGRPKRDDVAAAATAKKPNVRGVAAVAAPQSGRPTRKTSSVAPVAANRGDVKKLIQKKLKEADAKLKVALKAIEEVQAIAAGM